ncbi:RNA polymerase II elongation factor ELL3 [Eudromia elegans]
MRQPQPELRGRLRYRGCARGPRLSLLHVRLSEAAVRALRGCERWQVQPDGSSRGGVEQSGRPEAHPSLTVPCGPGEPPRLFAFFLSRCRKDEPQASFECARLAVPRLGESRLDTVGSIQEKITICAIEGSHPALQEQRPQPEESWGRAVTKLSLGRGVTAQRVADESYLPGKGSAHHILKDTERWATAASSSTSVPNPVQLLALRPHGKHEFVRRPPGLLSGLGQGWLPGALQEVVEQDSTESCCCLKEGPAGGPNQYKGPTAWPLLVPLQQSADGCYLQGARRSHRGARSQPSSFSVVEVPDYLRKYGIIRSAEQCRAYEAAFSADYAEYRYLHARIGGVSQKFIQLGARMRTLEAGTQERKALEATILHEYAHFKRTCPSYEQEKLRCEYLHQKLSHIKTLILHFEEGGSS